MEINKKALVILNDYVMAILAWQGAWWLRFNLEFPFYNWELSLYTLPLVLVLQGLAYQRFRLHRGIWRFASLPDLWNILRAVMIGSLSITLILFLWSRLHGIPRSILVLYPILLMLLLGGPRLLYRMWKDHSFKIKRMPGLKRVLIIGAGRAGEMLVRDMLRAESYLPVGFVDDNPALKNSEIHGVRVLGDMSDLARLCSENEIHIIVIAIQAATSQQMQKIVAACEQTGCVLRTLPKIQDMVSGKVNISELREVSIEDLLGREKVELEWNIIEKGLGGKVVFVSGGGGSIGSELCMQIARLNPAKLIIFERSEFNLYRIEKNLLNKFPNTVIYPVLGDLCDVEKIEHVLGKYKPEVIFHAAAYKHVPILQDQVREAVRNNIFATRNLADMAIKYNCHKFVFISTDKAVNPANILGATKRVAEMWCEWKNQGTGTAFITVRFGNVLDSDGSVVPLFREQIRNGGPVTVTHPDIMRFFMTIPEACQLILQSCAMGKGGEIFVLDMGQPIKIAFLAEQMIRLSGHVPGRDIEIVYTGLRPGEKLYEELFYENETLEATGHVKIMLARHACADWQFMTDTIKRLEDLSANFDEDNLRILLGEIVPIHKSSATESNVIPFQQVKT